MLRYLDVLIGLAIVMVLVSPMVTAGTQIYMWSRSRRTVYLHQMVFRLIRQLGNANAVRFEVTEKGQPAAGVELVTAKGTSLTTTNAEGHITVVKGLDREDISNGTLTFKAHRAGADLTTCQVAARFIPQRSFDNDMVTSDPSANGAATVKHTYEGAPPLASRKATLMVKAPAGAPITTAILVSVNKDSRGSKEFKGQPIEIALPELTKAPFDYEFVFDLRDGKNGGVTGESVEVTFKRFDDADRVQPSSLLATGSFALSVPAGMDDDLAETLTQAVATHPLLARVPPPKALQKVPPFKNNKAEVVEREQLIRVLLELAAADGEGTLRLEDRLRFREVLNMHGIKEPAAILSKVRAIAQQLEDKEPTTAVHIRNTQAIVRAAQSDFVGKINHWFDSASARATQQYAAEARAVTIVSALVVALAIQLDTLGLLQRLSSDPELRNSLVTEARAMQEKIDKATVADKAAADKVAADNAAADKAAADKAKAAADKATTDKATTDKAAADKATADKDAAANEIALAKAKLDEIERNLATLRSPAFSIVPDHFAWQRLHRGRLERNPLWSRPYPTNLYLVTGGATYTVPVRWRRDALADLKASIEGSGAPVNAQIEAGGMDLLIRADEPLELFAISRAKELPAPGISNARAALTVPEKPDPAAVQRFELRLDDTSYPLALKPADITGAAAIQTAVRASRAPVVVTCYDGNVIATKCEDAVRARVRQIEILALDSDIRRVRLLRTDDKQTHDLLGDPTYVSGHAVAMPLGDVAHAVIDANLGAWPPIVDFTSARPMQLVVDGQKVPLTFTGKIADFYKSLADAIVTAKTGLTVKCYTGTRVAIDCSRNVAGSTADSDRAYFLELTASDQRAREIRLLWNQDDPYSNLLNDTTRVARTWRIPNAAIEAARTSGMEIAAGRLSAGYDVYTVPASASVTPTTIAAAFTEEFAKRPVRARAVEYSGDDLVITAKRLGPVQLRYTATQADSNILNSFEEFTNPLAEMFTREQGLGGSAKDPSIFGLLLTWVLLSLGAPFWYDALKNLLKLRPTAAATEEKNRTDRSESRTDTSAKQGADAKKDK